VLVKDSRLARAFWFFLQPCRHAWVGMRFPRMPRPSRGSRAQPEDRVFHMRWVHVTGRQLQTVGVSLRSSRCATAQTLRGRLGTARFCACMVEGGRTEGRAMGAGGGHGARGKGRRGGGRGGEGRGEGEGAASGGSGRGSAEGSGRGMGCKFACLVGVLPLGVLAPLLGPGTGYQGGPLAPATSTSGQTLRQSVNHCARRLGLGTCWPRSLSANHGVGAT
jgi:hypothetical protein